MWAVIKVDVFVNVYKSFSLFKNCLQTFWNVVLNVCLQLRFSNKWLSCVRILCFWPTSKLRVSETKQYVPSAKMRRKLQFISLLGAVPQCYSEDLSSMITHSHWTLLMVSIGQFSWGLQKPLWDFFDHEVCRGCALGPNWGVSASLRVPCAPAPKVR